MESKNGENGAARAILCAVAVAFGERSKGNAPTRQWAAAGFLTVVEAALRGAARHLNIDGYIDMLESNQLESVARMDAHDAEQKAQRIAKSIEIRKARAAQRKATKAVNAA